MDEKVYGLIEKQEVVLWKQSTGCNRGVERGEEGKTERR